MDPFRWIGVGVVVLLAVIGLFCVFGIGVRTGPGYVAVGYTPTCSNNCYGGGGGGYQTDDALLRSAYK